MSNEEQRHDISDEIRNLLNGYLLRRHEQPWAWCERQTRFYQWLRSCMDKDSREKTLKIFINKSSFEWLMIDIFHCTLHPHAAGQKMVIIQNEA